MINSRTFLSENMIFTFIHYLSDKIKYLTNSLNSILNELGKSENVITASNKEIELILGECYTLEYFISKYDLEPSIKIKTYTDAIEIIALSL